MLAHFFTAESAEIEGIVGFVKDQGILGGRYRFASKEEEVMVEGGDEVGIDDLFEEAKRLVIIHKQGSVSLLQRRLGIGYARAGRLIDQLEKAGIVGPYEGSKSREVLVDESFLNGG
jgi:S-DNA-T family DNA segregation ATPase FtsK/SpoIIIE